MRVNSGFSCRIEWGQPGELKCMDNYMLHKSEHMI